MEMFRPELSGYRGRPRAFKVNAAFGLLVAAIGVSGGVHAATCEELARVALPGTSITSTAVVAAGAFSLPMAGPPGMPPPSFSTLPAFCRVSAISRPTADSDIRFEVWLPVAHWNGKFQGVGNGGLGGMISYPALAEALGHGYASASTDTGHSGMFAAGEWALHHPEKVIDFGHRAVHEMTVQSKALVATFYGEAARHSYWNGCSEGGNQGLSEAQRYPQDYDGIVAGAPANFFTHLQMGGNWISQAIHRDPTSFVPAGKMAAVHRAVLEACDALDGVKDGVLEDPRRCAVNLKALQCKGADGNECLTEPQIAGLGKVYAGARKPSTGEQIFPGYMAGGELEWQQWIVGTDVPPRDLQHLIQEAFFKYLAFENPQWQWQSFDFDKDVASVDGKLAPILNATNPDLAGFKARGGKIVQYHGWSDAAISPLNSIGYFNSVQAKMGDTSGFYRLFMVPGMGHCAGGEGTDAFDKVGTLERWVEQGIAPDQIVASRAAPGEASRTRPLCPYGKVARWKGSGNTDDSINFACVAE
jgi:feruloyl esterase